MSFDLGSLLYLYLPVIIIIGIITSYTDIKFGKILNKHLLIGYVFFLISSSSLILFGVVEKWFLIHWYVNVVAGFIFAYILWHVKMWKGGDAKLYLLFICLTPPIFYKYTIGYIYIFELVVNSILPLFLYVLYGLIVETTFEQKKKVLFNVLNPVRVINSLIVVFCIGFLSSMFFKIVGIQSNTFYSVILIGIFSKKIFWIFKKKSMYIIGLLGLVRLAFDYKNVFSIKFLYSFFVILAIYIIISSFLRSLNDQNTYGIQYGKVSFDISGQVIPEVKIPFALNLFFGALITVVCQGNLLFFIRRLIGW